MAVFQVSNWEKKILHDQWIVLWYYVEHAWRYVTKGLRKEEFWMVHVHQLQFSLSAMDVTVGMSQIHKKCSFLAFMKASRLFDKLSLFNVFFDFNWEISCSSSIVDAVADSFKGTQQIFQRCFNVVRRLIWRRDVG